MGRLSHLREAAENNTVWGDPIFDLVFDYGPNWRKTSKTVLQRAADGCYDASSCHTLNESIWFKISLWGDC